ncbi:hypothetical protein [Aquabacterium sp.]|uniref:hypothetical protein n=1 Tax=Aquabacterium sp. TaxID=1872578 RepID=UPI002615CBCC|nr:hypothetical protein [Aquabacterium sp.]MDD2975545.1 hypothetical protein [Aquabacterium sp.]
MAFVTEHKGVRITIWTRKLSPKHWTWEFSAGDWPTRRNDDSTFSTEEAAQDDALSEALNMIDKME